MKLDRFSLFWSMAGLLGLALLPALNGDSRSGLALAASGHGVVLVTLAVLVIAGVPLSRRAISWAELGLTVLALLLIGVAGFRPLALSGLGLLPSSAPLNLGAGLAIAAVALVALAAGASARLGAFRNDRFVATCVALIGALVILFVFWPVSRMLVEAFAGKSGLISAHELFDRLSARDIWSLGCLGGGQACGVAVNSLGLGLLVAGLSTVFGLAFALLATRTNVRMPKLFDALAILPIITPPFVVGLALIVLFGRTGIVTVTLSDWFGLPRTRWIYGLPGVTIAQVLSQAPLSFLIISGALKALSPTLEEAAQTLRASRLRIFMTVTLPLLAPALLNTFLLAFVESLSDFGNPLVLGGSFEVLSTKIFFAIAGAQHEPARAAILALILLAFTLAAFALQMRLLAGTSFVTVSGKGDSGLPSPLSAAMPAGLWLIAAPWIALTIAVYGVVLIGGFVVDIGRFDLTPTLAHFETGFAVGVGTGGLAWLGSAWDSFWVTVWVAGISAPLTAMVGLLTAYVLARQEFRGRRAFEFMTLLSFAIPGTVIGISYILAFNVAPVEITGTLAILIACFVFRNMPVGVRAGMAALSQIDRSLDEASATLRASTARTLVLVILPLIKPAIVATLIYSFIQAMTAVSAVIFLVTARYNLATAYVVGRVEAGEYSLAIAYCALMIAFMLMVIWAVRLIVGEQNLGRRLAEPQATSGGPA
ncbi:MAG: hypothetical protein ABS35_34685 [Kaistia sp. SCN 65-12]|nr:MAG: hypothetical protein ABS35_34685 [Kaistia sp. SCN 65-12]